MILTIQPKIKRTLQYLIVFIVLFSLNAYVCYSTKAVASYSPFPSFCVVLDAGHGGIDGGCSGVNTGVLERDINLAITQKLGKILNSLNIGVVYTRTNADGLYGTFASGFKKRDLQARCEIIKKANPNLVVSIHLNSFTSKEAKGAQVFYKIGSDISKELAQLLQDTFVEDIPGSKKTCAPGDFFMLNCTDTPGILVECGFLSNPEEEAKLVTDEYQDKIAYSIACGILAYFDLK